MNNKLIIALISLVSCLIGYLFNYITQTKECKVKLKSYETDNWNIMFNQQMAMYNQLQEELTRLTDKVKMLEAENQNLKYVLSSHGLEVITVKGSG